MADLTNQVDIVGEYGNTSTPISFSSNIVSTTIVEGLSVTKAANKINWVDGPLTYTIVITNNSGSALKDGVLTDKLDISLIDFDKTYGVKLNDQPMSNYNYNDGELKITLPELSNNSTTTILFQVIKKTL